jgi:transketolase
LPQLRRGELLQVRDGRHPVALIATGSMVKSACALGDELDASVWSAPWLKPLHAQQLDALARSATALITLEEHSTSGGLGGAVLEMLSETAPLPVLRVGIGERFSETCGSYAHAIREHGLDLASVRARVLPFAARWKAS